MNAQWLYGGLTAGLIAIAAPQAGAGERFEFRYSDRDGFELVLPDGLRDDLAPLARDAERLMRHGFQGLQTLEKLRGLIGEYGPPEILDNGDIVIRRKRAAPTPPPRLENDIDAADIVEL